MLAWAGLITIMLTLIAIMSGRISALVALITLPILAALAIGTGGATTTMITDGVRSVTPVMGMFVFAILYFGVMTDAGLLDSIVSAIVRVVGSDPRRIVVGTTLIALVSHLSGSGAVSFLITVTAMLPLYNRLGLDRRVLACAAAMGAGVNILPWSAVTLRAAAVLEISPADLFRPLIIPEAAGTVFVLAVSWWLGTRERARLVGAAELDATSVNPAETAADPLRRPDRFWVNLVLTITIIAILVLGLTEPMIAFMVGTVLALLLNYPDIGEQRRRLEAHAKEALMMACLLFAAGVFSGILTGTGMLTALAQAGTGLLPPQLGPHLAVIVAVLSMPLSLLFDASSFYFGVLPVVAEIGQNFGLEKAQIAQAALLGQMTTGFPVTPLTPSPFLLVGLLRLDLGTHQRYSIGYLFATTIVMTVVAVLIGVFPL